MKLARRHTALPLAVDPVVRGHSSSRFAAFFMGAIAMLLIGAMPASAHRPWFNLEGSPDPNAPYVLDDVSVSQVVYGGFATAGRIDYYRLTAPSGFAADIQLVVPAIDACAEFRPTLIISGPGLNSVGAVPATIATPLADAGTVVLTSAEWGVFYEPFTGTTYATSPRFKAALSGGDYLIAVIEPEGDAGTYGLALGGSERFGGDPHFRERIGAIDRCEPPALIGTPVPS